MDSQKSESNIHKFLVEHWMGLGVGSVGWLITVPYLVYEYITYRTDYWEYVLSLNHFFVMTWIPGFMLAGYLYDRKLMLVKKLTKSEKLFRNFIEHAGDAIIAADCRDKILMVNGQAEELTGYSREELLGMGISQLFQAEKMDGSMKAFETCCRVGSGRVQDALLVRKDEGRVYVDITYSLISLKGEDVNLGIFRDVTGRRRVEEELLDLKNFNQEMVEKSPLGILRLDKDMRLIYENAAAKRIMGVPEGEGSRAIGMDIRRISSVAEAGISSEFDSIAAGKNMVLEMPFTSIYGRKTFLRLHGVPLYRRRNFDGAILIIEDITERKMLQENLRFHHEELLKAYEKLYTLFNIDRVISQSLDLKEVLRAALGEVLKQLKAEAGGIYLLEEDGETLTLHVPTGVSKEFEESVGRIKLGEGVSGIAARERKPAGIDVSRYPSERLAPIVIKEGLKGIASAPLIHRKRVIGAVNIATRKERSFSEDDLEILESIGMQLGSFIENSMLHEDLKKAYEELKSLDELKSDVIANVSHELRTPITIVKSALEMLREERDEAERNRLISMARDALIRQDRIVGDLIDAAKMGKHEFRLKPEALDLGHVIPLVINEFKHIVIQKNITLESKVANSLPKVWADYKELGHVLRNLLSNALKFTGEGGRVTVDAMKRTDVVLVCVSDTGIGIAEEHLEKIFDRFYQIDSSGTRRYGGTGLGLAIVKEIVEAHGGRITVESEPENGSKFCFTLPTAG